MPVAADDTDVFPVRVVPMLLGAEEAVLLLDWVCVVLGWYTAVAAGWRGPDGG